MNEAASRRQASNVNSWRRGVAIPEHAFFFSPLAALALFVALAADIPVTEHTAPRGRRPIERAGAGENHSLLPAVIDMRLTAGAFAGGPTADAAVHVPPGFDPARRPGVIVYFHGWYGCVAAALAEQDLPCSDGGDPRSAGGLARQIDTARVNALVVAVELRPDMATGETGRLASPGGLRGLLREVFATLAAAIGARLDVDALDRVVVIAHSGGYQAAASVVELGDVPSITEVDLLDGLYGGDDVFLSWIRDTVALFDPRLRGPRFVDLYTCCGGTLDRSRAIAAEAKAAAELAGWSDVVYDDDGDAELDPKALTHPIVFKRVPRSHRELPLAYVRALVESAGFAETR